MAKTKKPHFALDWQKLEQFARDKSGLNLPRCYEHFGASYQNIHKRKTAHADSLAFPPSVVELCENMGLTLAEIRSLIIEIK